MPFAFLGVGFGSILYYNKIMWYFR